MSVTILDRPQKDILDSDGIVILNSLYNASGGDLPTNYDIGNDLSPINKLDAEINILAATNIGGNVKLTFSPGNYAAIAADDRFAIEGYITVTNSSGSLFIGQINTLDAGNEEIQTNIPFDTVLNAGTNTFNWYAKDYEVLFNIYVGLSPTHPKASQQPNKLIAQKSITAFVFDSDQDTNVSNMSATGLIKSLINATFEEVKATGLNLNQYTQFRVEYAEIYKRINPSTGKNELYDGTAYQRSWALGQPLFTVDEFNCASPPLNNEDFTTDLSSWTNTNFGGTHWVWKVGGTAEAATIFRSERLYQDFAYTPNATYNLAINISGDEVFIFSIFAERIGIGVELILRQTVTASIIINTTYKATYFKGGYADRISFSMTNSTTSLTTVNVDYFRQTQAQEGCLSYLSSVYAVRQLGATYGGSMGDFEGNLGVVGRFLTKFKTKILNPNDIIPEISLIGNSNVTNSRNISVKATVTYSDASVIEYYSDDASEGEGVYRVVLSSIITSIQNALLADNTLRVINIELTGVSNVKGLLSDWDKGTFENTPINFTVVNPDSLTGSTVTTIQDASHPRTGTFSLSVQHAPVPSNFLVGGIITTNSIQLQSGLSYILTGYLLFEQDTPSLEYVEDPNNDTYIRLAFFTTGGTLITSDVTYDKIHGNLTEYTKVTATITPATDLSVLIGFYKGGTNSSVGAQKIYIDDVTVQGPEINITEPLDAIYTEGKCEANNVKWLNDLGGWDNYTFEGKTATDIEVSDNKRYKAPVFGNWDTAFINGTGTGFEQRIEYNKVQTLTTLIIDKDLKESLATIKTSIHVLLYDEEIGRYMTVLVDKGSFPLSRDGVTTYRFQFDVIKSDNYVQNA